MPIFERTSYAHDYTGYSKGPLYVPILVSRFLSFGEKGGSEAEKK